MNKLNKSINLSKIYDNKFVQIILNVLFSLSTASLTAILIIGDLSNWITDILLPTLSFMIMLLLFVKFKLLKQIFSKMNKIILFISSVLGTYAVYLISLNMPDYSTTYAHPIFIILAIPSAILLLYWFYTKFWYYFKAFFTSLDKFEKYFLSISICIFTVVVIVVYNMTNIFSHAYISEENRQYVLQYEVKNDETVKRGQQFVEDVFERVRGDIVFTTDTQYILDGDIYNNITAKENDIRQPFFAIFSLPFTIIPKLISDITFSGLYPMLLAIVQGFIVFVTIILLEKMMKLSKPSKILFTIFMTFTYPTLLFLINLEQYVIPVFYLIVFIFMSIKDIKDKNMVYIMATGSLLTSGILFPLLGKLKDLKYSIKNIFFTFLTCIAIFIISAKILLLLPPELNNEINKIGQFTQTEITYLDKFNMYTNFSLNTIIAPEIEVVNKDFINQILYTKDYQYKLDAQNYRVVQANTKDFNIFGLVIFIIAVLGFALNRKDKFSQICFAWILFSIILLPVLGYGAYENGFILYTYYFSWAFVCLIFKFVEKLLSKWPKIKNTIYALAIIPMAIINFYGIYQIIVFGMQYYK